MGKDQGRFEASDPETGEVYGLNTKELIGNMRDAMLSWRRNQMVSMTWSQLSEDAQREAISNATSLAEDIVGGIVDLVAAAGNPVIHAKLDNFKVKDGEVTLTAKGRADDAALVMLNSVGHKALKIVVADVDKFDQHRETVAPEPDQPPLIPDDEPPQPGAMDDDDDMRPADADTDAEAKEGGGKSMEEIRRDGMEARADGAGPDENPYDGPSLAHDTWAAGWKDADAEIKKVEAAGAEAAREGLEALEACPWKRGTRERGWWLFGYDLEKKRPQKEPEPPTDPEDGEKVANDPETADSGHTTPQEAENPLSAAWWEGSRAADDGKTSAENPYAEDGENPDEARADAWAKGFMSIPLDGGDA